MDKLPTYEMIINPDETSDVEVSFVALVDKPAIEKNFLAFKDRFTFAVDESQRIISGPAMVADMPIYRRDAQGEYNVFFSADTIKQIALKFFKKDYQKNLNLFHDPALSLDGVTIFESFVSDKSRGIKPMDAFKDLPDGTWFISAKIENDAVWEKIKSGEVKGFSVEGIFSYVKKLSRTDEHSTHLQESNLMSDVLNILKEIKEKFVGAPVVPPVNADPAATLNGDMASLCKQCITDCRACVDAGVPDPCLSDCKSCIDTCNSVISDPSPENMAACLDSCNKCIESCSQLITDPNFSNVCSKCAESCKSCVSAMGGPMADMNKPDFASQFKAYDEKFAAYDNKLSSYEQNFSAYEQKFAEMKGQLDNANGTIVKLFNIIEQLANAPTADPVTENKTSFTAQKKELATEKRNSLIENLQALKNKNK